jgi:hypothetical protein
MRIITPTEIEHVAWEGHLEPLGETFKGTESLPRVTLGEPVWWPAEQAMEGETGVKWTPPLRQAQDIAAGDRRYTLLRLACTLHPPAEARTLYKEVTLTAYLRPRHDVGRVVAHDLYPQRLTVEEKGTFKVGLGPDLKFAGLVDVSLLELGAEIEYQQVYPVIQGYGLGESRPYWQFAHHEAHPLLGCQSVYAVLDAPEDAGGVRLSVELIAKGETRWGPITVGLPQEAQAHLSRTIE